MKQLTLLKLLIPVISSTALLAAIQSSYSQETGDCPASPQIGTTCTDKVSIRLRKLEEFGVDQFQKRYEPNPGYKIVNHEVKVFAVTGNSAPPSANTVQAGNTLVTGEQIQTAEKSISETNSKLSGEVKDPRGFAKASAEITNNATSELSQLKNFISSQTTSNSGLDITAKAAAICDFKNPLRNSCTFWGDGGKVDADVIIKLVYVGTPADAQAIAQKYITQLNEAAEQAKKVDPVNQPDPNNSTQATFGAF